MSETCDGCPADATHFLCDSCCHDEPDAIQRENVALRAEVERVTRERDEWQEWHHVAVRERDRLAVDALAALAGAGIATPEKGYVAEPWALAGDIARLAKERDEARAEVALLRAAKEQAEHAHNELLLSLPARLRDVAERQREACEEVVAVYSSDSDLLKCVRATPLVTEDP